MKRLALFGALVLAGTACAHTPVRESRRAPTAAAATPAPAVPDPAGLASGEPSLPKPAPSAAATAPEAIQPGGPTEPATPAPEPAVKPKPQSAATLAAERAMIQNIRRSFDDAGLTESAKDVHISVADGKVTLRGQVPDPTSYHAILRKVRPYVRDYEVVDQLVVARPKL